MALVAVLWIISLLAILAAGVGSSGQTNARLAFNTVEKMKARVAADAGVHRAIFDLLAGDTEQSWPAGGVLDYRLELDGADVGVQVRDEDGKIDLNVASRPLLQSLFQEAGMGGDVAMRLADGIDAHRRGDNRSRSSAFEESDYQVMDRADVMIGKPLRRVEQLKTLPEMTPALFRRIRPHVTIHSGAEGIDPLRASKTVLRAVVNASSGSDMTRTSRAEADDVTPAIDQPSQLGAKLGDLALPSRHLMFAIRASAESKSGGRFVREAIIALDGGWHHLPATIHSWQQGR